MVIKWFAICEFYSRKSNDVDLNKYRFFQYGPLKDLRNEMAPLIWSLMGLTVILIGFQLMFNKIEKRHNVVLNGLIAVLFIVGGPTMMDLLNKISTNAINDLDHAGAETAGQKIVKNNLADVNYYARQGFEVKTA